MVQEILVGGLFTLSIGYLAVSLKKTLSPKAGCNKGCGCDLQVKIKEIKK